MRSTKQIKRHAAQLIADEWERAAKKAPLIVSAATGKGATEVLRALLNVIDAARGPATLSPASAAVWQP